MTTRIKIGSGLLKATRGQVAVKARADADLKTQDARVSRAVKKVPYHLKSLGLSALPGSSGREIRSAHEYATKSVKSATHKLGANRLEAAKKSGSLQGVGMRAAPKAAPHALQRGKKGGTFYIANGKKVYAKK